MIIEINAGHCLRGFDLGARGLGHKEENLTRLVANAVTSKLIAKKDKVINCTVDSSSSVNESLSEICSKANKVKADLFISIHFNTSDGTGHGVEIFTYNGKEIKEARNILNNITALGFTNRGIKDGSHLFVVKNTNAVAMLIECCFMDNKMDMSKFNVEKTATAIVNGLKE
jgi:N-acetylmuramoyl-L-alanine amidase